MSKQIPNMLIKIEDIEILEPIREKPLNSYFADEFTNIPLETVPIPVIEEIKNNIKNKVFNGVLMKVKYNDKIYCHTLFLGSGTNKSLEELLEYNYNNLNIGVTNCKDNNVSKLYDVIMESVQKIIDMKGQVVNLHDLPITNEYNKTDQPYYDISKFKLQTNQIILELRDSVVLIGKIGISTIFLGSIAIIKISSPEGKPINKICYHCGHLETV